MRSLLSVIVIITAFLSLGNTKGCEGENCDMESISICFTMRFTNAPGCPTIQNCGNPAKIIYGTQLIFWNTPAPYLEYRYDPKCPTCPPEPVVVTTMYCFSGTKGEKEISATWQCFDAEGNTIRFCYTKRKILQPKIPCGHSNPLNFELDMSCSC